MSQLQDKIIRKSINGFRRVRKNVTELVWWHNKVGMLNLETLNELRNKFSGKRCFIMGNGPSLLKANLSLLKNEITIGSNGHFLIWDKIGYAPTFLTVEDNLVAEDRANELNRIKETIKIFPLDLSYCLHYDENTIFINFDRGYKNFPKFSDNFAKKVYWGGTVSFLNMQLAYYLGCSEIYLIGFDHEYKVTQKIVDSVITSDEDDVNHIHPSYFGKGYRWHDPMVARMEQSYITARIFLESRGIKIFNATSGGKLEVFERTEFNHLFP